MLDFVRKWSSEEFFNDIYNIYIRKKHWFVSCINLITNALSSLSGYQDSNLGPPAPKVFLSNNY